MAKWKEAPKDTTGVKEGGPVYGDFPASWRSTGKARLIGGSTGARLVEDEQGNNYVLKRGANAGHVMEEGYADGVYRALGIDVPEHRMYDTDTPSPVKLSKFIANAETLGDVANDDYNRFRAAAEVLQKNFAADALLGNWDVVGMGYDNALVGRDGRVWRIDNGGSLRYRARGEMKREFGEWPTELWTMREPGKTSGNVFGSLKMDQIAAQVAHLQANRNKVTAALPAELRAVVLGRINNMARIVDLHQGLVRAGKSDAVAESMVRGFAEAAAKGAKFPTLGEAM